MPLTNIRRVLHPTDLGEASAAAYVHAFRLALATRSRLDVAHVHLPDQPPRWSVLASPRSLLVRWRRLRSQDDAHSYERLGVHVGFVGLPSFELEEPLLKGMAETPPDLMVVGTHARKGFERLQVPSIAEDLARAAACPTLFVPMDARPFVDEDTGAVNLRHVVLPVAGQGDLDVVFPSAVALVEAFGATHVTFHIVHVGGRDQTPTPPFVDDPRYEVVVDTRHGPVEVEIVDAIVAADADLCVMATRGHDTFGDILRGSHTEIVVRNALCPILAVPLPG